MNHNMTPTQGNKKRLSLDVFKEKAIGNSTELNGGSDRIEDGSTGVCSVIITVITILCTLSSDSAQCCSNDDCH